MFIYVNFGNTRKYHNDPELFISVSIILVCDETNMHGVKGGKS